jgi:pre-mRNA-processing factor 8
VVTGNDILVLHREKKLGNMYSGPDLQDHNNRIGARLGSDLPEPSSDLAGPGKNNLIRQRDFFQAAFKSGVAPLLSAQRGQKGADHIRNTLNGTTGITANKESYLVNIPVDKGTRAEYTTFAWGNEERINVQGHASHLPQFFSTKEEAHAAAVDRSRLIHDAGGVTLGNL